MADHHRERARIGVEPNYSLARRKPRPPLEAPTRRSAIDDLIDAEYPRVDPEVAIEQALARLDIVGTTNDSEVTQW